MGAALPASLLVVRLGAIGDVVNALVFATAVKDASPDTRIGWAVHPLAFPLVEGHPSVDRVHLWPRNAGRVGWRMVRDEVRAAGYEVAVDLQRILKSAWLARSSGATRVLGFDRRRAKEFSWLLTTERIAPGDPREHMVERYLAFARHLGALNPVARHLLPPDAEAAAWAKDKAGELGGAPVILNLGASKLPNRWPAERFGELARALGAELDAPIVLTGGPADRSAADAALLACRGSATDLVGATSLRQLYHLMDHARLFVGCDTGPMHLAAARRLPVVALFGPADPRRTGPWGAQHRVARSPDFDPTVPFQSARMADLTVETVLATAIDLDREPCTRARRTRRPHRRPR